MKNRSCAVYRLATKSKQLLSSGCKIIVDNCFQNVQKQKYSIVVVYIFTVFFKSFFRQAFTCFVMLCVFNIIRTCLGYTKDIIELAHG